MKKKLLSLAFFVILMLGISIPAFASENSRLIDEAGLLSSSEYEMLLGELNSASEQLQFDFVIVTKDNIGDLTPEQAAISIYEESGYGYGTENDGVILLISMEYRDWCITSTGFGEIALNEDARNYIADGFIYSLSNGKYYSAFKSFVDDGSQLVIDARNGNIYQTGENPDYRVPFNSSESFALSLLISVIWAIIVLVVLKGQLKSVHAKSAAKDYVVNGSLHITSSNDLYLGHKLVRKRIQQDSDNRSGSSGGGYSSTRSSSSGGGHSSTRGKF